MNADADAESESGMMCCASCGITEEVNDIKLKIKCTDCDLVRYCSATCQREHKSQHEQACKKRAAEILKDEILFTQPEGSHLGDCPICLLPLVRHGKKSPITTCCSKMICIGCNFANQKREFEQRLVPKCPFCRQPLPATKKDINRNKMKRVEANDPVALRDIGTYFLKEGDYKVAFHYLSKAVEFGDKGAHYELSIMYLKGWHVKKDKEKEVYHLEQAAIGGHLTARYSLGSHEWNTGRQERAVKNQERAVKHQERAVKHYIIGAKQGHDLSLRMVRESCAVGLVKKEDFAAALRAHQAAVDATKSPQRKTAEAALKNFS
jgi:tetratricopeptide (TPR) repeat protein